MSALSIKLDRRNLANRRNRMSLKRDSVSEFLEEFMENRPNSDYPYIFLYAVKPHINREKLQTVKVRAGQMVKLDVDVKGEPPPTITWSIGPQPLANSPTCKIENEDYNTKLQLTETTRKDTGTYRIKAINDSGQDEAEVEIIVLGMIIPKYMEFVQCKIAG